MNPDLFGATGHSLLIAALLAGMARLLLRRPQAAIAGVALGAGLIVLPDLVEPSHISRGWIGDLAASSWFAILALLIWAIRGRCPMPRTDRIWGAILIVLSAAIVYPSSLGLGGLDVYAQGYGNPWLPILWGIIGAVAALYGRIWVAGWIALAGFLFATNLGPSKNFWDGLFDGLSFLFAVGYLIGVGFRLLRGQPSR